MTTNGHASAPQTRYRVPLQGAGKQQGAAKSVEGLGKQLDTLQARVVVAEGENIRFREKAETVGATAAGTGGKSGEA